MLPMLRLILESRRIEKRGNKTKKERKSKIPYSRSAWPVLQHQSQQFFHVASGAADEPVVHWWYSTGCDECYCRRCCRCSRSTEKTDGYLSIRHVRPRYDHPCRQRLTCDAGCSHASRGCNLPLMSVGREVFVAGEHCGSDWRIPHPCRAPLTGWVHWYEDSRWTWSISLPSQFPGLFFPAGIARGHNGVGGKIENSRLLFLWLNSSTKWQMDREAAFL